MQHGAPAPDHPGQDRGRGQGEAGQRGHGQGLAGHLPPPADRAPQAHPGLPGLDSQTPPTLAGRGGGHQHLCSLSI